MTGVDPGSLLPQHTALVSASAISSAVAAARGYQSVIVKAELADLGFSSAQARVPALLIPIWNVHGEVAMHQLRPDIPRVDRRGRAIKYATPAGSRMVLDVHPAVRDQLADPHVPLWLTEGVRKADAAVSAGLDCVALLGVWNWRGTNERGGKVALPDWESIALHGRDICIAFDSDVTTKPEVQAALARLQAFLEGRGARVHVISLPPGPGGAKVGLDDYLAVGHTVDELRGLEATADARPATTAAPTPTMTLGETLEATVAHLTRFIAFARPEHADAIALWVAHTHAQLEQLDQSPILALTSAVKQSGKTRVLDVIEFLVRDPWRITRPSESVLFRKIDADHPTVLLDEVDAIFGDTSSTTEGIRSLFNSGNRRGTKVPRSVAQGKGFALVEFDVFGPKATAGIGGLPDTILDRAIVIPMQRRTRDEAIEKLRERAARALGSPLREALAYHVGRLVDLTVADAALPDELDDRAQDGWEPLIAIADAAGDAWPARARRSAVTIFAARAAADDAPGLRLLADCRTVFEGVSDDFLTSADLRNALLALDQSPWADVRGREVTPRYLGKLLRAFGIASQRLRPLGVGNPVHGYLRADFRDAWERYCAPLVVSGTSGTRGTRTGPEAWAASVAVPHVSDVPDTSGVAPDGPPTVPGPPRGAVAPGPADDEPTLWTA